jgi:hypothetical protein
VKRKDVSTQQIQDITAEVRQDTGMKVRAKTLFGNHHEVVWPEKVIITINQNSVENGGPPRRSSPRGAPIGREDIPNKETKSAGKKKKVRNRVEKKVTRTWVHVGEFKESELKRFLVTTMSSLAIKRDHHEEKKGKKDAENR